VLLLLLLSQGRVATLQALSGTGALRVAAGFLARYAKVCVTTVFADRRHLSVRLIVQ
jgi:aspartate/tyrosine/aromatic aminotransferase